MAALPLAREKYLPLSAAFFFLTCLAQTCHFSQLSPPRIFERVKDAPVVIATFSPPLEVYEASEWVDTLVHRMINLQFPCSIERQR